MITRRNFFKYSAIAAAPMILPKWSIGKEKSPNERLNVALIGVGGIGGQAWDNIGNSSEVNIVAFCDVDDKRASHIYKKRPDVPRFRDFRVMLDKMDSQIDGVIVSTPDHMHYPICAWAIAKGKHVFCQKPLARTVWECRELQRLANDAGVITQMGNQGHTMEGWRQIREWYDAGILGQIEDVYSWTDRPIWPQGKMTPPPAIKVPPYYDHNLWLGVAPYQPYNPAYTPWNWRGLRNYGTGAEGDMACHLLDPTYAAFELGYPRTIIGNSSEFNDYSWPQEASTTMEFVNKRGKNNRIYLHWFDGGRRPKEVKRVDKEFLTDERNSNGTLIVGTKETLFTDCYGMNAMIFPRKRMVELKKAGAFPKPTLARSIAPGNAHLEWVRSCVLGKQAGSNFNYSAPFTEMTLLGMIALTQPDRPITYVPSKMKFIDCPEADKYVHSLYDYKKEFLV